MRNFEIHVVLVRTLYERNIGSVSRAMCNMGASKLILIDRKCEITYDAQQAAATGQEPLSSRVEYSNWNDFLKTHSDGIRIAFSARDGKMRQVRDFAETLMWLQNNDSRFQLKTEIPVPIYLFFGPEDWGLSTDDLDQCHIAANIPTFGNNTSLNLAQAVLLGLFILRTEWGGSRSKLEGQQPAREQSSQNPFPDEALRTWISEMGFKIENRKVSAYSVLKKMLMSTVPTSKELRILEIVLNQGIRKLREYNQLYKEKQERK
ncbi:MAG: tRNA (cytidine/uridine-2'-O-)-methyltransferase TrmJ [Oligoflexia bacterium]|nr:MAG: tRNA (cytidine/uridine-2'-O-)-methyltransferase TrmJ [Oligoflexia bacterium]